MNREIKFRAFDPNENRMTSGGMFCIDSGSLCYALCEVLNRVYVVGNKFENPELLKQSVK
jgi:hypothetical protein